MDAKSPDLGVFNKTRNESITPHTNEDRRVAKLPEVDDPTLEEPMSPAFAAELEQARHELREAAAENQADNQDHFQTDAPSSPTPAKTSLGEKIGDAFYDLAWNAKLTSAMVSTLGGFRPRRINGAWRWTIAPWTKIQMDPRQPDYGDNDYYLELFQRMKKEGVKTIEMEQVGGETPYVRPLWTGVQLLDHRRILTAQGVGLPIVVKPLDYDTFN